jgi:hypothetical protein
LEPHYLSPMSFTCKTCNQSFESKNALTSHRRSAHQTEVTRNGVTVTRLKVTDDWLCVCGRSYDYTKTSSLISHLGSSSAHKSKTNTNGQSTRHLLILSLMVMQVVLRVRVKMRMIPSKKTKRTKESKLAVVKQLRTNRKLKVSMSLLASTMKLINSSSCV